MIGYIYFGAMPLVLAAVLFAHSRGWNWAHEQDAGSAALYVAFWPAVLVLGVGSLVVFGAVTGAQALLDGVKPDE